MIWAATSPIISSLAWPNGFRLVPFGDAWVGMREPNILEQNRVAGREVARANGPLLTSLYRRRGLFRRFISGGRSR